MSGSCGGGVGGGMALGQSEAEAECKSFQSSNCDRDKPISQFEICRRPVLVRITEHF